jgi:hypothetical protein
MPSLPPERIGGFALFAQRFSDRVWRHAPGLVAGALLAPGKRPVSSCLRVRGMAWEAPFTNSHRVLNRAPWSAVQAGQILLGLLVRVLVPPGAPRVFGAEDTLERRSGRPLKAQGCDRDAVKSSRKHGVKGLGLKGGAMLLRVAGLWAKRVCRALFDGAGLAPPGTPPASPSDPRRLGATADETTAPLVAWAPPGVSRGGRVCGSGPGPGRGGQAGDEGLALALGGRARSSARPAAPRPTGAHASSGSPPPPPAGLGRPCRDALAGDDGGLGPGATPTTRGLLAPRAVGDPALSPGGPSLCLGAGPGGQPGGGRLLLSRPARAPGAAPAGGGAARVGRGHR